MKEIDDSLQLLKSHKVWQARTLEEFRIDENHYVNILARPFYQTMMAVVMIGGAIFGTYAIIVRTIHHWGEFDGNFFSGIFLLVFIGAGMYISVGMVIGFFYLSYQVYVGPRTFAGKGIYGQMKQLEYTDIGRIFQPMGKRFAKSEVVFASRSNPRLRISVNGAMQGFGEMVERVIDKSENAQEVSISEAFINYKEAWKKEPDWELINRAKSRAEENREKNEKNRGASP